MCFGIAAEALQFCVRPRDGACALQTGNPGADRGRVLALCAVLAGPGQSLAGAAHSKRLRLVIFAQCKSHPQGSACQLCLISAGFRFLGYFPILFQTNSPLGFFLILFTLISYLKAYLVGNGLSAKKPFGDELSLTSCLSSALVSRRLVFRLYSETSRGLHRHTHTNTQSHTCTRPLTRVHTSICVHTDAYSYPCCHTCIYDDTYTLTDIHAHACPDTGTHSSTHMLTLTCVQSHAHTYTHRYSTSFHPYPGQTEEVSDLDMCGGR